MDRIISLAAGVVQEFPPEQVIYAAAKAGFNAAGIWCDLESWTPQRTRDVKQALSDTGIQALDIEVVWFQPDDKPGCHDAFVDIAQELNAKNILCVSSEPDIADTKRKFLQLCQRAESTDIRVVLEFLSITSVNTLGKALEVVAAANHPAAGILIDALHLQRTGSCVDDVGKIQKSLIPYIQLCDGTLELSNTDYEGQLEDALYLRSSPGEGELPLTELLAALDPMLPISLEIRSKALIDQFPNDVAARAKAVFDRTEAFFTKHY